ncbi:hypothetical protein PQQ53_24480 [Paraburkholderia strydomiana]|jgi:hypothetical protein|uniref:FecR protein domain-containing protein n=1 Tax=Paraburkholderia strydomiana TaxID=1245417 RepID=A0ABW9EK86_9BURK
MSSAPSVSHRQSALSRLAACGALLAALIPLDARAGWIVTEADGPYRVIHATSVDTASGAGNRLADGDIVETAPQRALQMQDDAGNILALGPDTRALLGPAERVSLLDGWIKLSHLCATSSCPQPVLETTHVGASPDNGSAIVVTASNARAGDAAVFVETGGTALTVRIDGKHAPLRSRLSGGQFASLSAAAPPVVTTRLPADFLAGMPVSFREALRPLEVKLDTHAVRPDTPHATPVSYDDIAAWLTSALPARYRPDTRFATRFRTRLADPAFRHAIDSHLGVLPDWRTLLYPPPSPARNRPRAALRFP